MIRELCQKVEVIAPTKSTALILGETAIPAGLLESELFGHERGAFTGAISRRIGRFETVDTGTLFLDEIGDIPSELQPKLLRVLQEQEFERLGNTKAMRVDVRIVAATSRDLPSMVAAREFRADLYYRLNVIPLRVPALRDRSEDIPLLVRHFVEHYSRSANKRAEASDPDPFIIAPEICVEVLSPSNTPDKAEKSSLILWSITSFWLNFAAACASLDCSRVGIVF